MMTESFWVLKRPVSLSFLPNTNAEFAVECNCSSLSLDHVCTVYSPEKADRFDTKHEAMTEKRWLELGFVPAEFQITITECSS